MIQDIFKIEGLKALFVCLLLSPFWYLSVYLLNEEFFIKTDVSILMVLSFALTVSACMLMSIAMDIEEKDNPKQEVNFLGTITLSTVMLWIWKIVLFFFAYSLIFLKEEKLYFYWYVVIYFTPILLYSLYSLAKESMKK